MRREKKLLGLCIPERWTVGTISGICFWTKAITRRQRRDFAARWQAAKDKLDPATVINFSSSNDILGRFEKAVLERLYHDHPSSRQLGKRLGVPVSISGLRYSLLRQELPEANVFYAVKANPSAEVLTLLASLGSCFDTASVVEIQMALSAGATADRISFGNTIKKERCIGRALKLGIRLFAVDCQAEVEKIARAAEAVDVPAGEIRVFCRILCDGAGADWPLSRKFGCVPEMAADVLEHAHRQGLEAGLDLQRLRCGGEIRGSEFDPVAARLERECELSCPISKCRAHLLIA